MIEIRALQKQQGGRAVADALCLQVGKGETVAIAGPSGSGKTTLLRLIAGLELPDGGEIRIAGEAVDERHPPHVRGISFLFQTAALWPHLTVAGNIGFGLETLARAAREDRVNELLEQVGLAGFGPRNTASLSGGEARRVALARSLAPRRPILFLDEPTANLDAPLRRQMLDLIASERSAGGTTVLLATHDAGDAEALADRCLNLERGQLSPRAWR